MASRDTSALSAAVSKPASSGRKPYSDEELQEIARLYLEIQDQYGADRVAAQIAERLGENVTTVNKKIRRATTKGFLGAAQQGRGGRLPGPNLPRASS